jgi:phosphoserine phosphatase
MSDIKVLTGEKDFEKLGEKIVLMDVEGTLTPDDKHVPENPDPEHVYKVFEGESFEVKTSLGYWSGLHLLAGEQPSEYFQRVEKWWEGLKTHEEFEKENVRRLNQLLERTDHDTAQELVKWYNKSFLDLRPMSQELVKAFQDSGYTTGVISHTSQSLSCKAAEELGIDFVVPAWRFNFSEGEFEFIEKEIYADDKSEALDELKNAGADEVVFVGNGQNDVEIADRADKSFMVENEQQVHYEKIDAETGEFEEVVEKVKSYLEVNE